MTAAPWAACIKCDRTWDWRNVVKNQILVGQICPGPECDGLIHEVTGVEGRRRVDGMLRVVLDEVKPRPQIRQAMELAFREARAISDAEEVRTWREKGRTMIPKIRIYRDDNRTCIETTHTDPGLFVDDMAGTLASVIHGEHDVDGLTEELHQFIPQIIEIACKLRGYKADVEVEQVVRVGSIKPTEAVQVWPRNGSAPATA